MAFEKKERMYEPGVDFCTLATSKCEFHSQPSCDTRALVTRGVSMHVNLVRSENVYAAVSSDWRYSEFFYVVASLCGLPADTEAGRHPEEPYLLHPIFGVNHHAPASWL